MITFVAAVTAIPCRPLRRNVESWIQTFREGTWCLSRPRYTKSPYTSVTRTWSSSAPSTPSNWNPCLRLELANVRILADATVRIRALHRQVAEHDLRTVLDPPLRAVSPAARRREHQRPFAVDREMVPVPQEQAFPRCGSGRRGETGSRGRPAPGRGTPAAPSCRRRWPVASIDWGTTTIRPASAWGRASARRRTRRRAGVRGSSSGGGGDDPPRGPCADPPTIRCMPRESSASTAATTAKPETTPGSQAIVSIQSSWRHAQFYRDAERLRGARPRSRAGPISKRASPSSSVSSRRWPRFATSAVAASRRERPDPVALTGALHPRGMRRSRNAKRGSSSDGTISMRAVLFQPPSRR